MYEPKLDSTVEETNQNSPQRSKKKFNVTICPLTESDKKGDIALLAISVGMEYHEGEKLSAIADAIIEAKYKKCHILVGDKLQRHTLMMDNPELKETDAETQAVQKGKEWIERNQGIINKLKENNVEMKIIRWDEMLYTSEYNQQSVAIEKERIKENGYVNYVGLAITAFLGGRARSRKNEKEYVMRHFSPEDNERMSDLCRKYIEEELILLRVLAYNTSDNTYSFLYPTRGNDVSEAVIQALKYTLNENSKIGFYDLNISLKKEPQKQKRNPSVNKTNKPQNEPNPNIGVLIQSHGIFSCSSTKEKEQTENLSTSSPSLPSPQKIQEAFLMLNLILNAKEVSSELRVVCATAVLKAFEGTLLNDSESLANKPYVK